LFEVGDSTVLTSGYGKLIFGKGTQLSVIPKIENTRPSLYHLKADEQTDETPKAVCLATDFPSPDGEITAHVNTKEKNLTGSLMLDGSNKLWRYGAVLWDEDDLSKQLECKLQYNNDKIETEKYTDIEPHTCSLSEQDFITDERINKASLTVLGLRVLTAKAIVFNMIITLKLWSF
ncbi:T cell receptor alpha chain MC.7.G5-like, partial [Spea bombifrons]|uniref:T cell receptor alpha chain MC.7.G5-like n=1 Tax=Spea bombifrons TaxID=233779 RepID=UPI00234B75EC